VSVVVAVDHVFPDLDLERDVLAGADLRDAKRLDREDVLDLCADADAILAGARFQFDVDAIARLERCRAIVRYGIGVDNIDRAAAEAAGIWIAAVPDYCVDEVAEHALSLMLSLNRRIGQLDALVRASKWGVPPGLPVRRLSACTLGVIGFGRIGEAFGRRAAALGMRVLACDPARAAGDIRGAGATPASIDDVLAEADFISLHAPPSPAGPLLGADEIGRLKAGAIVINVGRSGLVDETALVAAIRSGAIGGAGLDVPAREPLVPPDPLLDLPNVIVTPHSAWYSRESIVELRTKAAEEAARVLRGERPLHAVNEPR
jgi:D-3-phosphoglycerate dehydrogenase